MATRSLPFSSPVPKTLWSRELVLFSLSLDKSLLLFPTLLIAYHGNPNDVLRVKTSLSLFVHVTPAAYSPAPPERVHLCPRKNLFYVSRTVGGDTSRNTRDFLCLSCDTSDSSLNTKTELSEVSDRPRPGFWFGFCAKGWGDNTLWCDRVCI